MFKIFGYIRSCIQWLGFGFVLTSYVLCIALVGFFISPKHLERILHSFGKDMMRVSGIDLHVHGLENIDRDQTYVVMFNHFNFLDHFVIYHALKIPMRGLEKEAHFSWPIYGTLMRLVGIIPIPPRGNTEKALQALEIAKNTMKKGFSMLVAPEGTRTPDGNLGPFKKGGFYLAIQTETPILPIVFLGMYEFNQKGKIFLKPGRVDLFIEKPIPTRRLTEKDVNALRDQVRDIFEGYYEEDA